MEASKVQRTAVNVTENAFTEQQREIVALFSASLRELEVGEKRVKQELGGYVVVGSVGIYNDATVNAVKGPNFPIMSLYERVLAVLSCRFVDKVVIGAPYTLDNSNLDHVNVNAIVHSPSHSLRVVDPENGLDCYHLAKELGLYTEFRNEETQGTTASMKTVSGGGS
ncbi:Ethanolamine-phosphate cytidylyltransferase [Podila clonocystis]|nr:Ethanolamine-phosphate cytidylyltransferase [Podila clonocystis]